MPRLLLVDDDAEVRESLAAVLRAEGHEVVTAANGDSALAALNDNPSPALILLDVMMPTMTGGQFLEACNSSEALSAVPVVILSAHEGVEECLFGSRVVQYLKKPFDPKIVLALIERWCTPDALARGAPSLRDDAVAFPASPPPDDWGGARGYYMRILAPFFWPRANAPGPSEDELVWLLRRLEHRRFVRPGIVPWHVLARMYVADQNPARIAERLASYWVEP